MANDVGSITASLKLESAAFIREMNRAAQATQKNTAQMQRSLGGLQKSFAGIGQNLKGFVAGFLSVAAVRSFAQMAANAVKFADGIGDAAAALGISADALQRYRQAGEQADVSIESMDNALKLFQKNLAAGKVSDPSFEAFIQRIREAPDQIEKVRIAQEGLGKQFQTGILLAEQSAAAFKRNYDSASTVSQQAIDNADTLTKAWAKLENALAAGFAEGFLTAFTGKITLSKEEIVKFRQAAEEIGSLAGKMVQWLGTMASGFASFTNWVASSVSGLREWVAAARDANRARMSAQGGEAADMFPALRVPTFGASSGRAPGGLPVLMAEATARAKALEDQAKKTGDAIGEWKTEVEAAKVSMQDLPQHVQVLTDLAQSFGDTMAASFTNAIIEGEKFSDMLEQLLKQLAQMALNAAFRMLFSNIVGQPSAVGGGGLLGAMFHGGGIVGAGGAHRLVPAAAFAAAPRFHNGFMPGEAPAILKKGEGVFTPEQMKALGGSRVNVNVINRNDSDVKVKSEDNANGGIDIEVMIDQVVARKLAQPGSSTNKMLTQFGVKQPPIRR